LSDKGQKCGIYYYSAKFSKRLTELGVPPAKTHIYKFFKDCPADLLKHYIRGYFDGDGSVSINYNYYNRPNVTFTGNAGFIEPLRVYLECLTGHSGSISIRHKQRSPNIQQLAYCGTFVCERILDIIYAESTIHLDRKYALYTEVKRLADVRKVEAKSREDKALMKEEEKRRLVNDRLLKKEALQGAIAAHIIDGWSIRQCVKKFKRNSVFIRNVINENEIEYPERRRMFASDPGRTNQT